MNKKVKILIILFSSLFFLFLFFIFILQEKDGMNNDGIMDIYYKAYTKEGWSKWSKNGLTSGSLSKSKPIKKIQLKLGFGNKENVTFEEYNNKRKKWIEGNNKKYDSIQGIKITGTNNILNKYDIYYRTYNSKNKWMQWGSNYSMNGNSKYDILGIQIKIIPKGVILSEYLKDYNKNLNSTVENF